MNLYQRVLGWLGLDGDCVHDSLYEDSRAFDEALEEERAAHRRTQLALACEARSAEAARREVAALRRLHLAYEVVLDEQRRKQLDALVEGIEETFRKDAA